MLRGINLGNWLVLEKWMDSTPFHGSEAADEVWLHRDYGHSVHDVLRKHRDTYITEEDFESLHGAGVELVRIPVPYFVFGDRDPYLGCIEYIDRAFEWAEKRAMCILLDLHTVPGSQNGFDNGGLSGVARWHSNEEEVLFALSVIERLGIRYGKRAGLYGIEVLNEPASWSVWRANKKTYVARDPQEAEGSAHVPIKFLIRFYKAAYSRLRRVLGNDKVIVFHDGFRLMSWPWIRITRLRTMHNIAFDTHIYSTFIERSMPAWIARLVQYASWRRNFYRFFYDMQQLRIRCVRAAGADVIVGEWCVENQESLVLEEYTHDFEDMQLSAYESVGVSAEFMWSYQTERDEKKRERLTTSWKRFWDWRYWHRGNEN